MIRFLLDTDICSYLIKQREPAVIARFGELRPEDWAISAITAAEIFFGLERLSFSHPIRQRATRFVFAAQVLDWPAQAAVTYAQIKTRMRKQPLADMDILIAAHAITLDATLVTNNIKHFERISNPLRFENWLE